MKELTEIKEMIKNINDKLNILSHNYVEIKTKLAELENPSSCIQREKIVEHDLHINNTRTWIRGLIFAIIPIIIILLCSTIKVVYDVGITSSQIEQNTQAIKLLKQH